HHLRLRVGVDGRQMVFSRGMRLIVKAHGPGRVSPRAAEMASDSLIVPVSTEGVMELDFEAPDAARLAGASPTTLIFAAHPLSPEDIAIVAVDAVGQDAPIACTVQEMAARDPALEE